MSIFNSRIDLSDLICGRPSEWIDEEENVREASKIWLETPTVIDHYPGVEKDENSLMEYFDQILQYE